MTWQRTFSEGSRCGHRTVVVGTAQVVGDYDALYLPNKASSICISFICIPEDLCNVFRLYMTIQEGTERRRRGSH